MTKRRKPTMRDAFIEAKAEIRRKAIERIDEYRTLLMPKSTIIRSVLKSFPSVRIREVRAMLKKSFAYKHHG